jgi:transcriptional regulator with XRE-family HTH domain
LGNAFLSFDGFPDNLATKRHDRALKSFGMSEQVESSCNLSLKIARLVEERGWNLEEFARQAGLNRLTVRQIAHEGRRRLRNATVCACAQALGFSVADLRDLPLEKLLARVQRWRTEGGMQTNRRLYEQATQPELLAWIERHPERARQLRDDEIDELLSLQGTGGPLTGLGVDHFVNRIERKRHLLEQVHAIAGTEYLELLEQFIGVLYEKIQPYRDRVISKELAPRMDADGRG